MPRTVRKKSSTDIYHIMLRGINRQQIFYEEEDFYLFLHLLDHYKAISGYELYAYCLMGNHIHLLLREGGEDLALIFKRIGAAFAYWYNTKYDRVGHIFQDRFRSEPIETPLYLINALRYIIQNPVAAGLVSTPTEYPFSSAKEYLLGNRGITDTSGIYQIMNQHFLKEYLLLKSNETFIDIRPASGKRITDSAAITMIQNEFGTLTPFVDTPKKRSVFNTSVRTLLEAGISIRQLSRITGISRGILQDCIKKIT